MTVPSRDFRKQHPGLPWAHLHPGGDDFKGIGIVRDFELKIRDQPLVVARSQVQDFENDGLGRFADAVLKGLQFKRHSGHIGREHDGVRQEGKVHAVDADAGRIVDDHHFLQLEDGLNGACKSQGRRSAALVNGVLLWAADVDGQIHIHHRR